MTSGEDLASADEVKVYDDEGDEEGKSSEENLTEDKIGLVTETEGEEKEPEENNQNPEALESSSALPRFPFHPAFSPFLYPYPHLPGRLGPLSPSLYMYGKDKLPIPPPAHMGHPPRLPFCGLPPAGPPGLFPFYPPDFSHWGPLSKFPPLSPSMIPGGPLLPGSSFVPIPGLMPLSPSTSRPRSSDSKHKSDSSPSVNHARHSSSSFMREDNSPFRNQMFFTPTRSQNGLLTTDSQFYPGGYFPCGFNGVVEKNQRATPKKPIIKKPLNAFMLFMKEMRQSVIEECTLKESAAINQILGRKWHALDRSEQAKYYEMAKKEKELHAQKYPGWSARDNYAMSSKKKKRRLENQDSTASSDSDSSRPIKKSDSKSFSSSAMRELSMNGGDHNHHHHPFSPLTNDFSRVNNMSITSL